MLDNNYKDYVLKKDIAGLQTMLENLSQEKHPEEFEYVTERIKDLKIDRALGSNLSGSNLSGSNFSEKTPPGLDTLNESSSKTQSSLYNIELTEKDIKYSDPIRGTFWKRIFALLLDFLFLGILGFILSIFFSKFFVSLGQYGIFIGFAISLLYFGIGNSVHGNGTLWKKIFGLVVVDAEYRKLTLKKSILRSLVFTAPYFLSGLALSIFAISQAIDSILKVFLTIIFLSYPIIYIINTRTRQTITDLLLKTYVVNIIRPERKLSSSPKMSWIISLSLALIFTILPMLIFNLNPSVKISNVRKTWKEINKLDDIMQTGININEIHRVNFGSESDKVTTVATISLRLYDDLVSNNNPNNIQEIDLVQNAVRIFLQTYEEIDQIDTINVSLAYGYTIGIFSNNRSISQAGSVHDWYEIVNKVSFEFK